jgi:hypothetical protein
LTNVIDVANQKAVERMQRAQPIWVDIKYAYEAFPHMDKYTILHAGPPITWQRMCGPMRGAVIAVIKYEGLAADTEAAENLADSGKIKFSPCHNFNAVGPMTGITSYSMPLYVVENKVHGNIAYSTINEGMGDVIRFGACSDNTIERLRWIEKVLGPALKKAVHSMGGLNLKVLIAQALQMGDELHMRNAASSTLFVKTIMQELIEVMEDYKELKKITRFLTTNNDQFFLNLAMCACKATADVAHNIENSTIITAMARNGVEIGIRISGLGDQWFTSPAAAVKGLYFAGYSEADANPDIGDSAIMETGGLGAFAMAAAPNIVKILGERNYQDALNYTMDMYEITATESNQYNIPSLDFRGTPMGIDLRKVIETGITPAINTAIASNKAGVGMIGAGVAHAPMALFVKALYAFAESFPNK